MVGKKRSQNRVLVHDGQFLSLYTPKKQSRKRRKKVNKDPNGYKPKSENGLTKNTSTKAPKKKHHVDPETQRKQAERDEFVRYAS